MKRFRYRRMVSLLVLAFAFAQFPSRDSAAQPGDDVKARMAEIEQLNIKSLKLTQHGKLPEAIQAGERAVELARQVHDIPFMAGILLYNLSHTYMKASQLASAQRTIEEAITLFDTASKAGDRQSAEYAARSRAFLGNIFMERGDSERAAKELMRAIDLLKELYGEKSPMLAGPTNSLALLLRDSGYTEQAKSIFKKRLDLLEDNDDNRAVRGAILNNLALIAEAEDDVDAAREFYLQALENTIASRGGGSGETVEMILNYATFLMRMGEFIKAQKFLELALKNGRVQFGENHPHVGDTYSKLAVLALARNDVANAIRLKTKALEIEEKSLDAELSVASERQRLVTAYLAWHKASNIISLHVDYAPDDPQVTILAFTRILQIKGCGLDSIESAQRSLRDRMSADDRALFNELNSVRQSIAQWALTPPAPGDNEYEQRGAALERQREALEIRLSERSAEYRVSQRPPTLRSVQEAIPADTALVEIVDYAPWRPPARKSTKPSARKYVAYVLRRQGPVAWVSLGDTRAIDEAAQALRSALSQPECQNAREAGKKLDRLLMAPVRKHLDGVQKLLISPEGLLNLVPFAALVDDKDRYLLQQYEIGYASSGRDLLRYQVHAAPRQRPLIIADPAFGGALTAPGAGQRGSSSGPGACKFSPSSPPAAIDFSQSARMRFDDLPATRAEAKDIVQVVSNAQLLTGTQATKEALTAVHGPALIHVATHGVFLPGTQEHSTLSSDSLNRSWLVFAGANLRGEGNGGILTSLELAGLDFSGTRLVVLSACETGVGSVQAGEGVFGLRRALVVAGSETQVMSLWQVPSKETAMLMVGYYDALSRGHGRVEAMVLAQRQMLAEPDTAHPFYWAPFIVAGNPAPLTDVELRPLPPKVEPGPRGCNCWIGYPSSSHLSFAPAVAAVVAMVRRRRSGTTQKGNRTC